MTAEMRGREGRGRGTGHGKEGVGVGERRRGCEETREEGRREGDAALGEQLHPAECVAGGRQVGGGALVGGLGGRRGDGREHGDLARAQVGVMAKEILQIEWARGVARATR